MVERAYTVTEIDALRRVVEHKYLWGCYKFHPPMVSRIGRAYREEEKVASVEQMVRTHMLAGHTADDLLKSEAR